MFGNGVKTSNDYPRKKQKNDESCDKICQNCSRKIIYQLKFM